MGAFDDRARPRWLRGRDCARPPGQEPNEEAVKHSVSGRREFDTEGLTRVRQRQPGAVEGEIATANPPAARARIGPARARESTRRLPSKTRQHLTRHRSARQPAATGARASVHESHEHGKMCHCAGERVREACASPPSQATSAAPGRTQCLGGRSALNAGALPFGLSIRLEGALRRRCELAGNIGARVWTPRPRQACDLALHAPLSESAAMKLFGAVLCVVVAAGCTDL